jgi:serine/threonine protein kinase
MSMGGPGDHPITDLIFYGQNHFPADIADLLRELHAIDPQMRGTTFNLDAYDWIEGRALDEGRAKLRAELQKHKARQI